VLSSTYMMLRVFMRKSGVDGVGERGREASQNRAGKPEAGDAS